MRILIIASEVAPFAKTGGLADVTGSLPKDLKRMGHDVRIIMPFYREIERKGFSIRKGRKSVEVPIGGRVEKGLLRQASLGEIPVYLIEHKGYFYRDHIYGTAEGDYPDNAERFAFFCRGVIDVIKKLDFRPDVLHCHDWQTALVPVVLKYELKADPFFARTTTVFTIHNLAYQGLFPAASLTQLGLDPSCFTIEGLEFYGNVNLMKGAIQTADVVTTVSETYRSEILAPEQGCGLDGVLRQRSQSLYGILNGIDFSVWNPAKDERLAKNYTPTALAGRNANKLALQNQLGLEQRSDVPLLAMVTRLVAQKGLDLLIELLPRFEEENLQLVILGAGDDHYAKLLKEHRRKTKGRSTSITIGFDPVLAHLIYGGSDMFLMPSHYEPCGLGQIIALRYGSVPIVRNTGGLADTVRDLTEHPRDSNGFCFQEYDSSHLWGAIARALEVYRGDKQEWKRLVRRGMLADFSWQRSAQKYEEVYLRALNAKRKE